MHALQTQGFVDQIHAVLAANWKSVRHELDNLPPGTVLQDLIDIAPYKDAYDLVKKCCKGIKGMR